MGFSIPERLKSRKFIVAVVTVIALAVGLPESAQQGIITIAMTYLGAQGIVDASAAWKSKK